MSWFDSYVQRYAPGIPLQGVGEALGNAADAAAHHKNIAAVVSGAVGDVAKRSAPGALGERFAGAAGIVGAVAQKKNVASAVTAAVGGRSPEGSARCAGRGARDGGEHRGRRCAEEECRSGGGDAAGSLALGGSRPVPRVRCSRRARTSRAQRELGRARLRRLAMLPGRSPRESSVRASAPRRTSRARRAPARVPCAR